MATAKFETRVTRRSKVTVEFTEYPESLRMKISRTWPKRKPRTGSFTFTLSKTSDNVRQLILAALLASSEKRPMDYSSLPVLADAIQEDSSWQHPDLLPWLDLLRLAGGVGPCVPQKV